MSATRRSVERRSYADEATRLLNAGLIHIFPADSLKDHGGFAPPNTFGSASAYMGIADEWTDLAFDNNHAETVLGNRITLQLILVHELDHLMNGPQHLSNTVVGKMFTPNTYRCSGQAPPHSY